MSKPPCFNIALEDDTPIDENLQIPLGLGFPTTLVYCQYKYLGLDDTAKQTR